MQRGKDPLSFFETDALFFFRFGYGFSDFQFSGSEKQNVVAGTYLRGDLNAESNWFLLQSLLLPNFREDVENDHFPTRKVAGKKSCAQTGNWTRTENQRSVKERTAIPSIDHLFSKLNFLTEFISIFRPGRRTESTFPFSFPAQISAKHHFLVLSTLLTRSERPDWKTFVIILTPSFPICIVQLCFFRQRKRIAECLKIFDTFCFNLKSILWSRFRTPSKYVRKQRPFSKELAAQIWAQFTNGLCP